MKKRIVSLLLVLAMVVCLVPAVSAATASGTLKDGFTWSVNGSTLTISGSGEMSVYLYGSDNPITAYAGSISSVVFSEGLTNIRTNVLSELAYVRTVTFPSTMTGYSLIVSEDFTTFVVSASNPLCCSVDGVILSKDKTRFIACPIGKSGSYTVPSTVTAIADYAFTNCKKLTQINLPEGVTTIGTMSFDGCDGLTQITLPATVSTVEYGAFTGADNINNIYVSSGSPYLVSDNGVLLSKDKTVLVAYPPARSGGYTVPSTVKEISNWAFYNCDGLTSVSLPNGLTTLDAYAFAYCSGLTGVTLPNTLTTIGSNAFTSCSNLASINLPDSLETIEGSAFSFCEKLTSVVIPDSVSDLQFHAFYNCKKLIHVDLPDDITTLDDGMFSYCESMSTVVIPENVEYLGDDLFHKSTVTSILFTGDAPTPANKYSIPFGEVGTDYAITATVYYPEGNPTWTQEAMSALGGNIEWYPYDASIPNPFIDTVPKDYYYDPVIWAYDNAITKGDGASYTFNPSGNCTRAQVVTFLWRAAGSPQPKSSYNPFSDVKSSDYYYIPVLWAVENGITQGTSKTTFGPEATCTRAQVATFLWRYSGSNTPSSSINPFIDVSANEYYYTPVLWAVENGITQGDGAANTFNPNGKCTRAQIVTFLYRAMD